MSRFIDAKTFLQTNWRYENSLYIPVDAVAIHPHNVLSENNNEIHESWKDKVKSNARMFFANSDDLNEYWKGLWDAKEHTDQTEIDRHGKTIFCSGIRPYMLPTDGWIKYLQDTKILPSLQNGIDAVLPEEPLAHIFSGYEDGFKTEYEKFYSVPWQPQHSSALALYRTAYLKAVMYHRLETELMKFTKDFAKKNNREIHFVIPIHSIFSNKASNIVAPLGMSLDTEGFDGYVGQVWTGPVNWCLKNYDSPEKSFFASAFALYDYFVQLTVETNKKLWLEVDPAEDDPNHDWEQFKLWYQHCTTAMLMMLDADSYEVVPWPERIFQTNSFTPGIEDYARQPAPKNYLNLILSATQVLQDMPLGGKWLGECRDYKIGIAVADSTMWQKHNKPALQGLFGLLMPLLQNGINAASFVIERCTDEAYIKRFKIIVVSFEDFKPYKQQMIGALAKWVHSGGHILILGKDGDALDNEKSFWWQQNGFKSPLAALLAELGYKENQNEWKHGKGNAIYAAQSPADFAEPKTANDKYMALLNKIAKSAGINIEKPAGYFAVKRGDFVIAHAEKTQFKLEGRFIDIFNPDLIVLENIKLEKTQSGIFKDITKTVRQNGKPKLLHTTYRLIYEEYADGILKFFIKGPEQTRLTARICKGSHNIEILSAMSNGRSVAIDRFDDNHNTCRLVCDNQPDGVLITVTFK